MPRARPRLSLQARAITLLAQREQSRQELRDKLLRIARAASAADSRAGVNAEPAATRLRLQGAAPAAQPVTAVDERLPGGDEAQDTADLAETVDALLDTLEAQGQLSPARFVESRIRLRAPRQGAQRIRQELARHGLALDAEQRQLLEQSEFERAREVWRRKYGAPAADAAGRARQARFLASRGFASDVIRRIVLSSVDDD